MNTREFKLKNLLVHKLKKQYNQKREKEQKPKISSLPLHILQQ